VVDSLGAFLFTLGGLFMGEGLTEAGSLISRCFALWRNEFDGPGPFFFSFSLFLFF